MKTKRDTQHFPFELASESTKHVPPLYRVVLLNDDSTPQPFVVQVLEKFFGMPMEEAEQAMLKADQEGKVLCGVYTFEIAETKVTEVKSYAREHDYSLICQLEEA